MSNLQTTYLGLKLKNPVIVSSSGLTNTVDKIKKLEKNNAGAVVLKSLFEEQINYDIGNLTSTSDYPEAVDYINNYAKNNSVDEYLKLIEDSKKEVSIPVIASINCHSDEEWTGFAKDMQDAGADALELNIYYIPTDKKKPSSYYENIYFDIVDEIKKKITIPIAVKLGYHFSNLPYMVDQLYYRGANGIVLFNRFYEPDIDVKRFKMVSAEVLSAPSDIRQSLRWIGIISGEDIKIDIAASTGIHDGNGIVKQILAGATVAMVCSALYKYGNRHLTTMIKELQDWMKQNDYDSIEDFRGRMSYKKIPDPAVYERSQFMKYFSSIQ